MSYYERDDHMILIVAPSIEPDKNVGAVRMSSLTRYLVDNNQDVFVLSNAKDEAVTIDGIQGYKYVQVQDTKQHIRDFRYNKARYDEAFLSLTKERTVDIVIVSGGPFYTFHISTMAKKLGIPCILDFRDPWFLDIRANAKRKSLKYLCSKCFQYINEYVAVRDASRIVTVTKTWEDSFIKTYSLSDEKIKLIQNGYDDKLLSSVKFVDCKNEEFSLGVFGKLFYYTRKYSEVFLGAMENLSDLKIRQIGNREKETDLLLRKHGISESFVQSTGFMDYQSGMMELNKSDAFLIIDERKGALGTKVYDYIYLNKPIIYVGPIDTDLARFISEFEYGYVCCSASKIYDALEDIKKNNIKVLTKQPISNYGRTEQNSKWLGLIKEIISN